MDFLDYIKSRDSGLLQQGGDPATLDGVPVRGVFDSVFPSAELGGVPVNILEPTFYLPESAIPTDAAGKILMTGGKSYTIVRPEPDGTGWAYLILRQN